jgi:pyrroloquinoline quinone biosynthesis protein B
MSLLKNLSAKEKNKVYFIHLNHTNPALNENSNAFKQILINGFHVARINEVFPL